jgi:hypothetical protein
MSNLELGAWSFPILLALIFLRIPIGLAMLMVGFFGTWLVTGSWVPILAQMKSLTYDTFSNYSLSIVPLFLLMGQFATRGGMSQALFRAAETWLGHRKGGVAMAAVGACAGFGAICGSSLATAATMGQVALPELRRYGYSGALATGCLAAGGTLGILIPPSVVLVIYAILTEQNIIKLFMAAMVPGVLAALGYMLTIAVYVRLKPGSAGLRERASYGERFASLLAVWPVLAIFLLVIGGIYAGWFTPTEGAAVGAAGTGLVALRQWRPFLARPRRGHHRHRVVDRDDLLHRAGRRRLQRLPRLLAAAAGGGEHGRRHGDQPVAGAAGHPALLPGVRLRHGLAVDDPADHSDLLSHRLGAGFRPAAGGDGPVVRRHRADRRRGRPDHAAGRHEPLRHQLPGAGRAAFTHLRRRPALRAQRHDPGGDPGRLPGHHPGPGAAAVLDISA